MADFRDLKEGIRINYSITSHLGEIENYRYKQNIIGDILLEDEKGETIKQIGQINADKLLLPTGMDNEWSAFDIFDTEQYILELGEIIWDFDEQEFVKYLNEYYTHDFMDRNVLFINSIEIIAEYRGMKIGEHAIKDFANNFMDGCGLFVIDSTPAQNRDDFENRINKEWIDLMKFDEFERDSEAAKYRLIAYLKRTGFDYLPDLTEDYMFINPCHINVNFDYIELL